MVHLILVTTSMSMKNKKLLSVFLVFLMLFSTISPIFADQAEDNEAARKAALADAIEKQDVEAMVKNMTIEEKIAQTFMMSFEFLQDGDQRKKLDVLPEGLATLIQKYHFGSIILYAANCQTTAQTLCLTRDMQKAAISGNGIPMIIATDQEGGSVYRIKSGTALPGNMAIAATNNTENAYKTGQIIGKELSALGINTTLAPVMDVNNNAQNPVIGERAYSDDPNMVAQYGVEEIKGLSQEGVIGCAKHFPGHGDTNVNSHYGLPEVNKNWDELNALELIPFKKAIETGIDMIMTAHILYPQIDNTTVLSEKTQEYEKRPATLSNKIITERLKNGMNFQGVVVSDDIVMGGIAEHFNADQAIIEALKAGVDMVCNTQFGIYQETETENGIESLIASIKDSVESTDPNSLSEARLNDAVTRILTLKRKKGILNDDPAAHSVSDALNIVGNAQHRAFEKEVSAQAITVVKNNDQTLPHRVSENEKVLMLAPDYGDNHFASMIMGWNRAKVAGLIPNSAAVRCYEITDTEGDYSIKGDLQAALDWADVAIIISQESGSVFSMTYADWASHWPKNISDYYHEKGKKSIILSVYRPYDCQLYPNADGIAIAYGYNGSNVDPKEALKKCITESPDAVGPNVIAGIEVILGVHGASGILPVDIPRFNSATEKYDYNDIVYPRGYGLTYEALSPQNNKAVETGIFRSNDQVIIISAGCVFLALALITAMYLRKRAFQQNGEK